MRLVRLVVSLALLAAPAQALTLVDMGGQAITLAGPPQRIVSLVPSVTEIVFALGGEVRLVGVTDFCDFPPAARQKPSVGGMLAPNLEMLVTLRPDLVVVTDSGNRRETFGDLQRLGIPVYQVHASRVAEMLDVIQRVGAMTGQGPAVTELTARLQKRFDTVREAVRGRPRPRVLYVLWPEPLIVPGRESLVTELIQLAGGDSITAEERSDYPRFSLEAAVARRPEVILLARHGAGTEALPRQQWDRLTSLPAVRAGRVHAVDGNLLHRYGPRIADGVEALARAIHPEAFR